MTREIEATAAVMAERAEPFADFEGLARLADRWAGAQVVCLGESTHGTSEFYRARAAITERLVARHGFRIVAVEGDWPDAEVWNAEVQGIPRPRHPDEPFVRFPRWMWRNAEMRVLLDRLRVVNADRAADDRVGFYGLDLYSLCASIDAVLDYLAREAPEAEPDARALYGCLKPYCGDPARYLRTRVSGAKGSCEDAVVGVLKALLERQMADGADVFGAAQNARVVANAEEYYRAMYSASERSWNLRDRHMAETLDRLIAHRDGAKAVVWAHNSHVGDARATEMGRRRGELNIGQLLRERWGDEARLVGFSTDTGTVAAASDWGSPMEIKTVRPGLPGSWEDCARRTGLDVFLLDLRGDLPASLTSSRLQRAIGVIYRPETERLSHYFDAELGRQFDGWVWIRKTGAVTAPEERPTGAERELYPFGL